MSRKELHIDWTKFDGYTFQDMCNDLLVSENISIVPFKSGPYADKGQDARLFEGSIGDISGRIIFQSKYHEPKPGRINLNALKTDIKGTNKKKGELDKAEEAKADHLIILSNIALTSPNQHDELLKLAVGRSVKLHIWDEEKIKALLVQHPYVRFFHIKGPDYPMFVPYGHFFERFLRDSPKDILTHLTNLSGREDELGICREFLSLDANLLAIYAAPGQGKSRLVLEFSRSVEDENYFIPLFVRPEGKVLKDHLEELNPQINYLIFIEDAHQFHNRLGEFLSLLEGGSDIPKVKLVLTARKSLSGIVDEAFGRLQPLETRIIRMPELPEDEILKILNDQLPMLSEIHLKDLLPFVKDSPLLAVAAARLIKMGKPLEDILKPGQLRNFLFEIPIEDLTKYCIQKGEDSEKYKRILTAISAIQPTPMNNGELVLKISEYLDMEEHDFRSAVDMLVQLGFLKRIGRMIRLIPESLSDIILEKYCLDSEGNPTGLGEKLAEYFFDYCLEELLNNLCDIGEITFREKKPDILKSLFDRIKLEALQANNFERGNIIEKLQQVGARRADDVLETIEIMMHNPSKDTTRYTTHSQLLGSISNLLGIVARNPYYIKDALQVLKNLILHEEVDTGYANYQPGSVIEEILGYDVGKPIEFQERALVTLIEWKKGTLQEYSLSVRSMSSIFTRTVSFTRTYGATFTLGSMALIPNQPVVNLRKKALTFLTEALRSGIKEIQLAAVETAAEIGELRSGPGAPEKSLTKILSIIEKERLQLLDVFEILITSNDIGFLLTGEIEKILWHWWWGKSVELSVKSLKLIQQMKHSAEYSLFKLLYIQDCPVSPNLSEAERKKTKKERENFYFDRHELEESKEFYDKLVSAIRKLDNPEYWSTLLANFDNEVQNNTPTWHYGSFLSSLAMQNPNLGYHLYKIKKDTAWKDYGSSLLVGIRISDNKMWESHLESLLKSKGIIDESAISDCIRALYGEKLISLEIEFLKKYAQNESENIRIIISQSLLSVAKNSWLLSQELAKRLIKHTCSRKLLDNICRALIRNRPEQFKESPTKVESRILDLLIEIDELRDYGCREFIVKFARREPQILLRLVEERHKLKKSLYELKDIFQKVIPDWKKRKDFHQIFEKICTWANQGVRLNLLANEVLGLLYDDNILQMVKSSINPDNPNSIIKAAQIASNFPKSDNFFELFAKLLELAEPHGDKIFETVASRFSSAAWTGAWSRSTGQPSDFHLNIKTQCERILGSKSLSIRIRKVFESNIKGVDQAIQDDLNSDRELFEL